MELIQRRAYGLDWAVVEHRVPRNWERPKEELERQSGSYEWARTTDLGIMNATL